MPLSQPAFRPRLMADVRKKNEDGTTIINHVGTWLVHLWRPYGAKLLHENQLVPQKGFAIVGFLRVRLCLARAPELRSSTLAAPIASVFRSPQTQSLGGRQSFFN